MALLHRGDCAGAGKPVVDISAASSWAGSREAAALLILTPKPLIGKVISCVICLCMCANPLGQFAYGLVFEKLEHRLWLPFYPASLAMLAVAFLTRRLFRGVDGMVASQRESRAPRARPDCSAAQA